MCVASGQPGENGQPPVVTLQPALRKSAFAKLHDELLVYFTLFLETNDLLRVSEVNSVLYIFCKEQPLWMHHCLRLHQGEFKFRGCWKLATFFPLKVPAPVLERFPNGFPTLPMKGFYSEFLYRRWCRGHMDLSQFDLPADYPRSIEKLHINDMSFQLFYEQYARVPFILTNALTNWKATTEWTEERLIERFPSPKHRVTHNLDVFATYKSLQMSFDKYFAYCRLQHDETPLYIFDPRFGEKMPEMLNDYEPKDLKAFEQDFLKSCAEEKSKRHKDNAIAEDEALEADNEAEYHKNRPDFRWLVIGPARSGAPWHQDPACTSAWNSLLKGRKRWALYPPDHPPPAVSAKTKLQGSSPIGGWTTRRRSGHDTDWWISNMTSLWWYLHVYPTLSEEEKPIEVIQEEGDTIYVPSGWWHLVLNLDVTIAVTQNFIDAHNVLPFLKDLVDDQEYEPLQQVQKHLPRIVPQTKELFELVQVPLNLGFLNEKYYLSYCFGSVNYWQRHLVTLLRRHWHQLGLLRPEEGANKKKIRLPTIKNVTSRVNPSFVVGKRFLVKLFSEYNEQWGEWDLSNFLALESGSKAPDADETAPPHPKRQKREGSDRSSLRFFMEECYRNEKDGYEMMKQNESLHQIVPKYFASGHLFEEHELDDRDGYWRWPYVIIEYKHKLVGLDGIIAKGGMAQDCWKDTAQWIGGTFLKSLHETRLDTTVCGLFNHPKASWDWYFHYLLRQRRKSYSFHLDEFVLPVHLLNQLNDFLPPISYEAIVEQLAPANHSKRQPVLLHGDLTEENILGQRVEASGRADDIDEEMVEAEGMEYSSDYLEDSDSDEEEDVDMLEGEGPNGQASSLHARLEELGARRMKKHVGSALWKPTTVIDFADIKTGDPLYDLVAVFVAALHCDRNLWREVLQTPYWQTYLKHDKQATGDSRRILEERLMCLMLLNPSHALRGVFYYTPQLTQAKTWSEVATMLFGDLVVVN